MVLGLPYVYFTVFTVSVFLIPPGRTPFTHLVPVNDQWWRPPCTDRPQYGHHFFARIFIAVSTARRCLASMATARWMELRRLLLVAPLGRCYLIWPRGQIDGTLSSTKTRVRLSKRTSPMILPTNAVNVSECRRLFHILSAYFKWEY
jgi:hypothetical protein